MRGQERVAFRGATIWDVPTARSMDNMIVAKCDCGWTYSRDYTLANDTSMREVHGMLMFHMWSNHATFMMLRALGSMLKMKKNEVAHR